MNRRNLFSTLCIAAGGMAALVTSLAFAETPKDAKPPAGMPDGMPMPPGWTAADMQACMAAGTPGKMHEHLAKCAGVWQGKTQVWMGPAEGAEPMRGECTSTNTMVMDGRYVKSEMAGEFPGMGLFTGFGINGFDNVSEKFVGSWIDNQSSGIMNGTGELSADGKTMNWAFTYNCPITKKAAKVRQVETYTSPTTMKFEMFNTDPKSGKEYKCMVIEFTKKQSPST